ncbi:MAG: hypothetical protein JO356_05160, partial [Acidobacteria bacterium]|nr:hypothetical protein [Acidobacteriota bacterium]
MSRAEEQKVGLLQDTVRQVWSEVLERENIGPNENFFDLGGESLKALEVISRLHARLGVELPLIAFFEDPTIAHLADVVAKLRIDTTESTATSTNPRSLTTSAPLSFAQLQYWVLEQSDPFGHLHTNARVLRIRGDFHADLLKRALNRMCSRHQVLASRIQPGIAEPMQIAEHAPEVPLEIDNLSDLAEDVRELRAVELARQEWRKPFDLSKQLPLRARLIQLKPGDHLLVIIIHHVVSDGHSASIFFEDLAAIYNALLGGAEACLPELPMQYFDYAAAERLSMHEERLGKELEFWRANLKGAPAGTSLPTDKPRPERAGHSGSTTGVILPLATVEGLKRLAQNTGATLFSVLMGGLRILLYQWAGEFDTVVGTVASTRSRAGTDRLVGCFVNFLPIRNRIAQNESAVGLLEREKRAVRDAFAHQDCPFLKVVTSASDCPITQANPVYNVGLLLQNFPEIKFSGDTFTGQQMELESGAALLDLRFIATERSNGLQLDCEFKTELFLDRTIRDLLAGFTSVLSVLAETPERRVSEFPIPPALKAQAEAARRREQPWTIAIASSFTGELVQPALAFWMKKFGVGANFRFAPYNQVFQQLLDPHSPLSTNRQGFNIVLLRITDYIRLENDLPDERKREKIQSSVHELLAVLRAHPKSVPTLVALCPAEQRYREPAWARFLEGIEREIASAMRGLDVHLLTPDEIFKQYPIADYNDEYTDKIGHVPYTTDFFTALATALARRIVVLSSHPKKVIVLDGDGVLWPDSADTRWNRHAAAPTLQTFLLRQSEERGMLLCLRSSRPDEYVERALQAESQTTLRAEHFIARRTNLELVTTGLREFADELQLPLDEFILISANSERCREVQSRLPEVLTLELPARPAAIPAFFDHVWTFDEGTGAIDLRLGNFSRTLAGIARELRDIQSIRRASDALQLTTREQANEFVAPSTPVEQMISGVWAQVLNINQVGVQDNFFALGGHSLMATQVVARIRQLFALEIPLRTIFEAPSLAEFAAQIEAKLKSGRSPRATMIPRIGNRQCPPLSFAQQRLWFLDQLDPGNPLYNMAQMMRLRGKLEVTALQQAVNAMVARHEALRTSFVLVNNRPVQSIAPRLELSVPLVDLSALPTGEKEAEIEQRAREEARLPFNLTSGPLIRAQILRIEREDHVFLLTMHHIVSDRWSLGIAAEELAEHYRSLLEQRPADLGELPIQYADFAVWQRERLQGEILNEQLAYWKKQLAGTPARLELPTDHPRPAQMSQRGAWQTRLLPTAMVEKLTAFSQEQGVTLFMTLLAAFESLLAHYTSQDEIVVGSPIAGRNFAELESLIGFFVNTLPLRADLSGDPSFRQLLAQTKQICLDAYAHQDIPFEKLVEELEPERSLSHNPIFQVLFAHQNAPMNALDLPGVELERTALHPGTSILDMSWFAIDVPQGLLIRVEYSTDLFDADTIVRWLDHFVELVRGVSENPELPISQVPLLGEAERQRLLIEFNANRAEFPVDACLHHLVEESVARTPDAIAVVCGNQR